jgi:predicted TIM-barrel fold metal-dependent hydrolase
MSGAIDVHAHYYPRALVDRMADLGSPLADAVRSAPEVTIEQRLGLLDVNGIDRQVLSVGILTPDFAERELAIQAARLANDVYAGVCRSHPRRLGAFGTVPLPHVDAAIAELRRCLDELGMLGIALGCSVAGYPLDEPTFAPFFEELDRRAGVLFLHPVGTGTGPHTIGLGLTWMVGAVFEDTIAALRLVLSGMLTRYSRMRVIVSHLGGTLPFLLERLEFYVERERKQGGTLPFEGKIREQLRRLWYDTVNLHPAALRCAVDSLGAERLLVGTDFPFLPGASFCACMTYLEDARLAPAELRAIRRGNAEALLGLGRREQAGAFLKGEQGAR